MAYESVFTIDDYVLFGLVICIYLFSGYHFSRATGKTQNDEDFEFASRSFNGKLMCMSLASSMIPGLSILNITVQFYYNGPVVGLILLSYFIGISITAVVFIPLFSRLNTSSIFTYLKLRFSRFIQVLAAIVFCIHLVIFCILNSYVSVSALSEATGFPSQTVVLIGSVTTLYTTLGGLRAVVWTQAYQYVVVCIGLMGFVIKGVIQQRSDTFTSFKLLGDSISSPVPLWYWTMSYMIGATFQVISVVAVNQSYIQRALAIQPQKRKRVFLGSLVPISVIFLLLLLSALIIHVTSYDCSYLYPDLPFLQVLPYTVAHGLNDHPGMSGFFLAVVFSASMSSTSSTLHSVATIVGEDFIKSTFGELRDSVYLMLLKGFVICIGVMVIFVPLLINGNQAQQVS
ncbi:sodium-coupled monocarboxylate transporter 1-like [Anneissia japonica]|uniref:sodium-coupled monocarboxylate transporter 1-like n=1 Tax=Anneissia japonica TaxID=1529436 RepID=UPI00142576A0|nr:sodium-coupled monocarboxylate transporter 1-like [Anneissia japonica]